MARDLFGDVVHPSSHIGGRKRFTLPLSLFVHGLVLAAVILVPLMASDELPAPRTEVIFPAAVAPPPPPPEPPNPAVARRLVTEVMPAAIPTEAPTGIAPATGLEPDVPPGIEVEGGLPNVIEGSGAVGFVEPPPPPPPPTKPTRVSSGMTPPVKVRDAQPVYSTTARLAHVDGTVILEAVIAANGHVAEVRVLRSIPLLDQAAVDAVRQWVYSPALLSGVPVPVVVTVTVTFTLK